MAGSLTDAQVAAYRRDGFLFPIEVFSATESRDHRQAFEALERRYPDGTLPRATNDYLRTNMHIVVPLATQLARHPAVLDAVESILGPDLLVWGCELFVKEPHSAKIVSWHQDLTYWGLGETDEEMTAWIALSPATPVSGCMRFVPGSHQQRIVAHRDTFAEDNLLSRGQEIAVAVDEAEAVPVILEPGQMSLHHGRMFHASGPNESDDRRIGLVLRFVTPGVRQQVAQRDYAIPVRGEDSSGNWVHVSPPSGIFDAAALALYEQVIADQAVALAQGAEQPVNKYEPAANAAP